MPPSPLCVALASMVAPLAMLTVVAAAVGCAVACSSGSALPCQLPPTSTVPPPAGPVALMRLLLCSSMLSPCRLMLPPLPDASALLASKVPALCTRALPDSTMRPPCC